MRNNASVLLVVLLLGLVSAYTTDVSSPDYVVNETEYSTYSLLLRNIGGDITDAGATITYEEYDYQLLKVKLDADTWQFNITKRNPWFNGNGNYSTSTGSQTPISQAYNTDQVATMIQVNDYTEVSYFKIRPLVGASVGSGIRVWIYNQSGQQEYSYSANDAGGYNGGYFQVNVSQNFTRGIYFFVSAAVESNGAIDNKIYYKEDTQENGNKTPNTILIKKFNGTNQFLYPNYGHIFNLTTTKGYFYNSTKNWKFNYSITNSSGTYYFNTTLNYTNMTRLMATNITQNINLTSASNSIFGVQASVSLTNGTPVGAYALGKGTQSVVMFRNQTAGWGWSDNVIDGKNTATSTTYYGWSNTSRKQGIRDICPYVELNLSDSFYLSDTVNQIINCDSFNETIIYQFMFCGGATDNGDYCGNCTDLSCTKRVMNFSYFDEDTLVSIQANQTATFTITSPISSIKNYSKISNTSNAYFVYPNFQNITVSSFEQYSSTGYSTRNRFYSNAHISNDSQTIYLLSNGYSTYVTIYVMYSNGQMVPGVTVVPLRYYPATNAYTPVGMTTTDSNGQSSMYLRVDNIYYKYAVYDSNGNLLYYSSTPGLIAQSGGVYSVSISIGDIATSYSWLSPYATASCVWSNDTNTVSFNYLDVSGLAHSTRFWLERQNGTNKAYQCNYTINSSAGSYLCTLDTHYEDLNNYTYLCVIQDSASPWEDVLKLLIGKGGVTISVPGDWQIVMIMMIVCLATMMIYPPLGVFLCGISLMLMDYTGMLKVPVSVSATIALVAAVLAFLMMEDK